MNEKEIVQKQFGRNAGHYVTSESHAKGLDLAKVAELVKEHGTAGHLLDIATGGGHVANALAPHFEKVTAVDLTAEMLKKAEQFIVSNGRSNVTFILGDAEALPFHDESFNVVACRIAAHHFPDVDRFVSEVFRVLKTGGLFVLVDNVAPEKAEYDEFYNVIEKKRDQSHIRAHKKSEWISMVEMAGLSINNMSVFEKNFLFENWCTMMNLPAKEQEELNTYMKSASLEVINHFKIEFHGDRVHSFKGQSMLVAAKKIATIKKEK